MLAARRKIFALSLLLSAIACRKEAPQATASPSPAASPAPLAAAGSSASASSSSPAGDARRGAYETVFYPSDALRIEAYVYRPEGDGPFPAIVYNHGSRKGHERAEQPFKYVGEMLAAHGYLVIVPERRGYGKSDGVPFSEGGFTGEKFVPRMQEEAGDVLAARAWLATRSEVDAKRIGVMGWSFGGIVTMLALSRTHDFKAAVDQAGGALSWKGSAPLREALVDAASKVDAPVLSMDAENDATTESVRAVDDAIAKRKGIHELVIYPPFTPSHLPDELRHAPGHAIFGAEGMSQWQDAVVRWLDRYVKQAGG